MSRLASWALDGSWPPEIVQDGATLATIDATLAYLAPLMVPASVRQIASLLHRVRLHYHAPRLNDAEAAIIAGDWLRSLDGAPPDLIADAFDAHRDQPQPACRFAPQTGEIIGHMGDAWKRRKRLHAGLTVARERLAARLAGRAAPQCAPQSGGDIEAPNEASAALLSRLVNRLKTNGGDATA